MIGKIMYLCRKYRDEIIFGKLLENLLDMKKPPKKSVVFILRRGRDSNSWCELPRTPVQQTGGISHSPTSPGLLIPHNREAGTKVRQKCQNTKYCGQEFFQMSRIGVISKIIKIYVIHAKGRLQEFSLVCCISIQVLN